MATFDLRTATITDLLERAGYLENFPARGRYRDDLHGEAKALRLLAADRANARAA
jgi:hypothetical protein